MTVGASMPICWQARPGIALRCHSPGAWQNSSRAPSATPCARERVVHVADPQHDARLVASPALAQVHDRVAHVEQHGTKLRPRRLICLSGAPTAVRRRGRPGRGQRDKVLAHVFGVGAAEERGRDARQRANELEAALAGRVQRWESLRRATPSAIRVASWPWPSAALATTLKPRSRGGRHGGENAIAHRLVAERERLQHRRVDGQLYPRMVMPLPATSITRRSSTSRLMYALVERREAEAVPRRDPIAADPTGGNFLLEPGKRQLEATAEGGAVHKRQLGLRDSGGSRRRACAAPCCAGSRRAAGSGSWAPCSECRRPGRPARRRPAQ